MEENIVVTYTTKNGEKESEVSIDDKTKKLIAGLNNPLKLLKNSGKLGVNGAKAFLSITTITLVVNILFFIAALVITAINIFETGLVSLGLVLLAGVFFSVLIIKKAYGYVLLKVVEIIYKGLAPLFKRLCGGIISRVADELNKRKTVSSFSAQTVTVYNIFNEKLSALPNFARKALWFVVKRVPFVKFINHEITDTVLSGNKEKAAEILYNKADAYIYDNIFNTNSLTRIWLLLPLNIAVQLVFIIIRL